MADMENFYNDLIIINQYFGNWDALYKLNIQMWRVSILTFFWFATQIPIQSEVKENIRKKLRERNEKI